MTLTAITLETQANTRHTMLNAFRTVCLMFAPTATVAGASKSNDKQQDAEHECRSTGGRRHELEASHAKKPISEG